MFYMPKKGHNLPYDPFKAIVSPRPIGWISSKDKEENINLAPYSFFNAIADKPPMVMFSTTGKKVGRKDIKDSFKNIVATKEFVVNIVSEALISEMNLTSGSYPSEVDEFDLTNLKKSDCKLVSVPRISESPASLECRLFKVVKLPGDDNNIIIGEVVGIHLSEKYITNGIFDILAFNPVARLGYKDYTTVFKKFSLNRPKWIRQKTLLIENHTWI